MFTHARKRGGDLYLRGANPAAIVLLSLVLGLLTFANVGIAQEYFDAKSKELGEKYGHKVIPTLFGDKDIFPNNHGARLMYMHIDGKLLMREDRVEVTLEQLEEWLDTLIKTKVMQFEDGQRPPIEMFVMFLNERTALEIKTDEDKQTYHLDTVLQVYWDSLKE